MPEVPSPYGGRSVLVVDDDQAVRLILRRVLGRLGFEVQAVEGGQEALEVASCRTFDLVITDLSMPGMGGMDLLRELGARGLVAPVVVLTATGSVTAAVEAIKAGAFEFIEKPLRPERLEEVVRAALSVREPRSLPLDIEVEEPVRKRGPRTKPPPVPSAAMPERIGRYEVVNKIGHGGMGVVLRCRDPLLGRIVAVKVLHVQGDTPEEQGEASDRFKREAAAAAALAHPGIIEIHDLGRDEERGEWFIVMELVEGRGLHLALNADGKLAPRGAVSLGFQLADALAFAHGRGVVHRDIKPSNVITLPDGRVKLLDFGLAAVEGWNVTMTGRVFGSPSYMAPERIRGGPGGPESDQFSLGVVLYEAATGQNPFEAETPEGRLVRVLEHEPPPLHEAEPPVGVGFSEIVSVLMSKEPAHRFPRMDDAAEALAMVGGELDLKLERHTPQALP